MLKEMIKVCCQNKSLLGLVLAKSFGGVSSYYGLAINIDLTARGRGHTLRKHAYSNILKILQPKTGKFPDKKF